MTRGNRLERQWRLLHLNGPPPWRSSAWMASSARADRRQENPRP